MTATTKRYPLYLLGGSSRDDIIRKRALRRPVTWPVRATHAHSLTLLASQATPVSRIAADFFCTYSFSLTWILCALWIFEAVQLAIFLIPVFGVGAMIHEGLKFGQLFEFHFVPDCVPIAALLRPAVELTFTFVQLYFIFLNSKVKVKVHLCHHGNVIVFTNSSRNRIFYKYIDLHVQCTEL